MGSRINAHEWSTQAWTRHHRTMMATPHNNNSNRVKIKSILHFIVLQWYCFLLFIGTAILNWVSNVAGLDVMQIIISCVNLPISLFKQLNIVTWCLKKLYYYSYIGSYLKAVRVIAEYGIVSCFFTEVRKPQLQPEVTNHCLYTVQIALNFAAGSFCCKITLIWLGSSRSV